MEMSTAGDVLRRVMQQTGWNQQDLARATGLSPQTVHRWLTGKATPRVASIASALYTAGLDPHEYDVNPPPGHRGATMGESPPAWFAHFAEQVGAAMGRAQSSLDRIEGELARLG